MPANDIWSILATDGAGHWIALGASSTTCAISSNNGSTWTTGGALPSAAVWQAFATDRHGHWITLGYLSSVSAVSSTMGPPGLPAVRSRHLRLGTTSPLTARATGSPLVGQLPPTPSTTGPPGRVRAPDPVTLAAVSPLTRLNWVVLMSAVPPGSYFTSWPLIDDLPRLPPVSVEFPPIGPPGVMLRLFGPGPLRYDTPPIAPQAGPLFVQGTAVNVSATGGTLTPALTGIAAGDTLVLSITNTSVTTGQAASAVSGGGKQPPGSTPGPSPPLSEALDIWIGSNNAGSAGSQTATVTLNGVSAVAGCELDEFSRVSTTEPLQSFASNTGTATTVTSPTQTPADSTDVVYLFSGASSAESASPSSPWAARTGPTTANAQLNGAAYLLATTGGTGDSNHLDTDARPVGCRRSGAECDR